MPYFSKIPGNTWMFIIIFALLTCLAFIAHTYYVQSFADKTKQSSLNRFLNYIVVPFCCVICAMIILYIADMIGGQTWAQYKVDQKKAAEALKKTANNLIQSSKLEDEGARNALATEDLAEGMK